MLNPRVLLCATDPGGAANLAPILVPLDRAGADVFVVTSKPLAARFDVPRTRLATDVGPDQAAAVVEAFDPKAVITGTTRYDSPDRRLPAIAARRRIRSVAVLDERYLYRARFENAQGHVEVWPDAITVLDEESRQEAVAEGLPAERLWVTGSPALAELVATVNRIEDNPPPIPHVLQRANGPVVTFLSETLSVDYGTVANDRGLMGLFLGYTEDSVLHALVEILAALDMSMTLIDKRHPADSTPLPAHRRVGQVQVTAVRDEPLWPLLWHSHVVVGMRSMALLEAALIGVPALSFQPGLIGPERCTAVRLGLVPQTVDFAEARAWLTTNLCQPRNRRQRPKDTSGFAPADAARRIAALALAHQP